MNKKLVAILTIFLPFLTMSIDKNIKNDLERQALQLKAMLLKSNHAYMHKNTPMYEQNLMNHWIISYILPFKALNGKYAYNSEILLTESKKIAEVIAAIEELEKSDNNYDSQVDELIKMLILSNDAYIANVPMYQQDLTLEWVVSLYIPYYRWIQGNNCYNAEITLNESSKLASIIMAMKKFKFEHNV